MRRVVGCMVAAILIALGCIAGFWVFPSREVSADAENRFVPEVPSTRERTTLPWDPDGSKATAVAERMILNGVFRTTRGTTHVRVATTFPAVAEGVEFDPEPVVAAAKQRVEMWRHGGYRASRDNWLRLGREGEPWWVKQEADVESQYDRMTAKFPKLLRIDWESAKVMPERAKGMSRDEHYLLEGSFIMSWMDRSDGGVRPREATGWDFELYSRLRFRSDDFERAFMMVPFVFSDEKLNPENKPIAFSFKLARGPQTQNQWVVWQTTVAVPTMDLFVEHFAGLPR